VIERGVIGGRVVYAPESMRAFALDEIADAVWTRCDGERTFDEICLAVGCEFGARAGRDTVWLALDRLRRAGLLDLDSSFRTGPPSAISRRRLIKRLAATPAIAALFIPSAAAAASCVGLGESCDLLPCCDGLGASCVAGVCTNVGQNDASKPKEMVACGPESVSSTSSRPWSGAIQRAKRLLSGDR